MKYQYIQKEEELKNRVSQDYFKGYDASSIIGNIDFAVRAKPSPKLSSPYFLWAEAKRGSSDVYRSLAQLILTIGKARTYDTYNPPTYLGALDAEKIIFIPYGDVSNIFYLNDFNWRVTPSNHQSREFNLILDKISESREREELLFYFGRDDRELREFIQANFTQSSTFTTKITIDKNNFMIIYNKWLDRVKPTIQVDWDIAKESGIIDGDFYLADLISEENKSLKEKLYVLLKTNYYELSRKIDQAGMFSFKTTAFYDQQKAHREFWNIYERPPREEYWDYIIDRRDLLVPQDVRERKGSFYTPTIWVEKSQEYLAAVLGEDWQSDYYVWDCAAGTGNLLVGLTNKYNIWASTLDQADVDVMLDRIENGANLLENHVFQFDFLNDSFDKLPQSLKTIIDDPEKRKKLVVYINPPYAEATTATTVTGTGDNKAGVSIDHAANKKYKGIIGNASNEIFALFMARIYNKLPGAKLAQFSKLKFVQGSNFLKFREFFLAKYLGGFVVPANTFDNVRGQFPIGFTIWNTNKKEKIKNIQCEVFEKDGRVGVSNSSKTFYGDLPKSINKWIKIFDNKISDNIGLMGNPAPDFQHNSQLYLSKKKGIEHFNFYEFTNRNIFHGCIYLAVRHTIPATWINDRDQFLHPIAGWESDQEFQNDCLAYTLFHGQNRISRAEGINHWIPFTEEEVGARERFESSFMTDFIRGRAKYIPKQDEEQEFEVNRRNTSLEFSNSAQSVFQAGLELWKYYHEKGREDSRSGYNANASLYDIRNYFQGQNAKGKMNARSSDHQYNQLMGELRLQLKNLSNKIEPKVYAYRFLLR